MPEPQMPAPSSALTLDAEAEAAVQRDVRRWAAFTDGDPRRVEYLTGVTRIRERMARYRADENTKNIDLLALEKSARVELLAWAEWCAAVGLSRKTTSAAQNLDTAADILAYIADFQATLTRAETALERQNKAEYLKLQAELKRQEGQT